MKIKKELAVNDEKFYDYLLEILLAELKQSVSKDLTKEDIKVGFKFKRKANNVVSNGEIIALEKNRLYHVVLSDNKSKQHIIHNIIKVDDNHIIDEYEEKTETDDLTIKMKSCKSKNKIKKQMNLVLEIIEKQLNSRKD